MYAYKMNLSLFIGVRMIKEKQSLIQAQFQSVTRTSFLEGQAWDHGVVEHILAICPQIVAPSFQD